MSNILLEELNDHSLERALIYTVILLNLFKFHALAHQFYAYLHNPTSMACDIITPYLIRRPRNVNKFL